MKYGANNVVVMILLCRKLSKLTIWVVDTSCLNGWEKEESVYSKLEVWILLFILACRICLEYFDVVMDQWYDSANYGFR